MNLELSGKTTVFTGGSRGIGLAVARTLLDEGMRVVSTLHKHRSRLRTTYRGGHEPMTVEAQKAQDWPSTDRIEKRIVLRASRSRVWRAITTAEEFGAWFRVKLDGVFAEGATIRGRITHPGYEHVTLDMLVERIEPERYFAYRPDQPRGRLLGRAHHAGRVHSRGRRGRHGPHDRRVRIRSDPARPPGRGVPHERPGVGRVHQGPRAVCLVAAARRL